jgi:hypothetical protein
MATAIACDLCETEPAVLMQTNLGNGDTISVGQACLITFAGGTFAEMVNSVDTDVIAMHGEALTSLIDRLVWRMRTALPGFTVSEQDGAHTEHDTGPREEGGVPAVGTEDASVSGQGVTVQPL